MSARAQSGVRLALAGLAVNLALAAGKLALGAYSHSVAVASDGFNNLADCLSCLLLLVGFALSGRAGDAKHPYGYGRMEYVGGFTVSCIVLATALSLGRTAVLRLFQGSSLVLSGGLLLGLGVSVVAKGLLGWGLTRAARTQDSPALRASGKDALSDALVTATVLLGLPLSRWTPLPLDGLLGLAVAALMLLGGWASLRENLDLLLGAGADEALCQDLDRAVAAQPALTAVKTLSLHDYGVERQVGFVEVGIREGAAPEAVRTALDAVTAALQDRATLTLYAAQDRGETGDAATLPAADASVATARDRAAG